MLGLDTRAEGLGDVDRLEVGHVDTQKAAAKANLQRFGIPQFHRGRGSKAATQGAVEGRHHRVEFGLQLGLGQPSAERGAGSALTTVAQAQGKGDVAGNTVNGERLQLAGFGLSLGEVDGFDHRQAQIAVGVRAAGVVGGDVGHINIGQASRKVEHKDVFALSTLGRVDTDRDLACAKQGVERALNVVLERGAVAVISDGTAVLACAVGVHIRNLEVAAGHFGINTQRSQLEFGHVGASQCPSKTNRVGIDRAVHQNKAQTAQRLGRAPDSGGAQGGLDTVQTGTKRNVSRGVGFAAMGQAQTEHAQRARITVNRDGLYFGLARHPVAQQFIGHAGAGDADAFVGNVDATQGAHKADHVALTSAVAAVIADADVGRIGV